MKSNIKSMFNRIKNYIFKQPEHNTPKDERIEKAVDKSVQKYKRTYMLLEEYDNLSAKTPEVLAKPKQLQGYLQSLQN